MVIRLGHRPVPAAGAVVGSGRPTGAPPFLLASCRDSRSQRTTRRRSGAADRDWRRHRDGDERGGVDAARVRTDGSGGTVDDRTNTEPSGCPRIEFIDCETVRVVGDVADVIVGTVFWDEHGMLGDTREPVGGVDGERLFHVPSIYGRAPAGPIVTYAETFDDGTTVVPGNGDVSARNPNYASCEESALESLEATPPGDDGRP